MNIYIKFTLLCLVLIFLTTVPLFFVANREAQSLVKEQILTELKQESAHSIENIERFIYQRLSDVKSFAIDPILRTGNIPQKDIMSHLKSLNDANEIYNSISYFNFDRVRIADSKGLKIGDKHSYSIYWKLIKPDTTVVMDVSKSESLGKIVMHFAAIVRDYKNQPVGVVVTRVLIDKLYEVFVEGNTYDNQLKKDLKIDLLDREGYLLYSNYNIEGVLKSKYSNVNVLKTFQTQNKKVLETDDQLFFYAPEDGYLNFKGNDWAMIMSIPPQSAFKALEEIRNKILLTILPIILLSIILTLIVARLFVNPIKRLTRAVKQMREGNLNVQIRINSNDEIGNLATNFQRMSAQLKRKIEEQDEFNETLNQMNVELNARLYKINEQKTEIEEQRDKIEKQNQKIHIVNRELSEKNKDITDSINYAKRIQSSMLPDEAALSVIFSDHMILWKPRDIVSGDFYWFDQVQKNGKEYFVIACADCTGHGVPGAIMSMLGSNLLTNIVHYTDSMDAANILNMLNSEIKRELNQEVSAENSQDGMEILLLVIDMETKIAEFAGAGRPLFVFNDGTYNEYSGNKITIGGVMLREKRRDTVKIDTYLVPLKEGDVLYLSSDGYKDQFGGIGNKTMGKKKFKELLFKIHNHEMAVQKLILENEFFQWKDNNEQVDDILIMGLKM
jgi:serine phosphatase RsbU (regulator of sigma subunit)